MSYSFSLVCQETKESIWIGQGRNEDRMAVIYTGHPEIIRELIRFLNNNINKNIRFMNSDRMAEDIDTECYVEKQEEEKK